LKEPAVPSVKQRTAGPTKPNPEEDAMNADQATHENLELYLDELNRRLARSVSTPRRADLLTEIRAHLEMSAKDVPMKEALTRFGAAAQVADDLIYQERGYRSKPSWRLAAVPALLDLVTFWLLPTVLATTWLGWYGLTYNLVWLYLPFLVLLSFVVSAYRSRRWLWGPMAVATVAGFGLTVAIQTIPWYGQHVEMQLRTMAVPASERKIWRARMTHDLELATLGYAGFEADASRFRAGDQYKAPSFAIVQSASPAPFLPLIVKRATELVPQMGQYATKSEAAMRWQETGSDLAATLRESLAEDDHYPTLLHRSPSKIWTFTIAPVLERLAVLALVNALILAWLAFRKRFMRAPRRATAG